MCKSDLNKGFVPLVSGCPADNLTRRGRHRPAKRLIRGTNQVRTLRQQRDRVATMLVEKALISACPERHDLSKGPAPGDSATASAEAFHSGVRSHLQRLAGVPSRVHTLAVGMVASELFDATYAPVKRMAEKRNPAMARVAGQYIDGTILMSTKDRDLIDAGFDPARRDGIDPYAMYRAVKIVIHEHVHGLLDDDKNSARNPRPERLNAWGEGLTELTATIMTGPILEATGVFAADPLLATCLDPPSYPVRTTALAMTINAAVNGTEQSAASLLEAMVATGTYQGAADVLATAVAPGGDAAVHRAVADALIDGIGNAPIHAAHDPAITSVEPGSIRDDWRLAADTAVDTHEAVLAVTDRAGLTTGRLTDYHLNHPYTAFGCAEVDTVARENQPQKTIFAFANNVRFEATRADLARHHDDVMRTAQAFQDAPPQAVAVTFHYGDGGTLG